MRESNLNTAFRIQILEEEFENVSDEKNLEVESNTHKVNQEPPSYKEDVVDVNNIDEDKNNDFLEKDNQKKTPDWGGYLYK